MGVGLVVGLIYGLVAAKTQQAQLLRFADVVARPIGSVFLNLLSMVVIPLVAAALFAGVAGLGDVRKVGRLGVRTVAFFWSSTIVAIVIGFAVAALLLPIAPISPEQQASLRAAAGSDLTVVQKAVEQIPSGAKFLVELIPTNPVRAAVDANLLPLLVFVTMFGIASAALPDEKRRILTEFADAATQALIKIVGWVLLLAPVGIFALVAPAVAKLGWDLVKAMVVFWIAVIVGVGIFIAGVYLPAVRVLARIRGRVFLQAALPSMAMGFSTTSSLATLPTMLQAAEGDLHMSRNVAGFALPLGASLNRAGSALYQAIAVLFLAELYGVHLGAGDLFQAGAAVFLASLTVASVPYASVVSLQPAFSTVGLPLAGLNLLIGLDRIPDMFRTMTNVTGHLVAATVVAHGEGEQLG
jgi:Na+/H+-dicarboxylate symporter